MARTNAIVTASYAPDFERCRILCESIDRYAEGFEAHYLLIDAPDRALFAQLEGPRRHIITDSDLLPWWFRRLPQAVSPSGRRLWVSALTRPQRGWQVQQIMRMAIARQLDEDGLFYCDSDTAFIRPFDLGTIWSGDRMRLYRHDGGARSARSGHLQWAAHARQVLGIAEPDGFDHDYICSFVTWRRKTVIDMCAHIERTHGMPWIAAVGKSRHISECMIYGAFVDGVLGGADHVHDPETLCPMQWFDPAPTDAELAALVNGLSERQAGVGVQSFIALEPDRFRRAVFGAPAIAA